MTELVVQPEHLAQIRTHAQQIYPEECCGLLIGDNERKRLIEVVPVENSWDEKSAEMLEDGSGGESSPVLAVPVEEEVRIPKGRIPGFPWNEMSRGFPRRRCFPPFDGGKVYARNESAVELAREEPVGLREARDTRTRSGVLLLRPSGTRGSVSTAGTRSDGVAVSGDSSPESVRRFSRSANPEGSKRNRFSIAPQVMLQMQKAARERHLDIIGIYHSHPDNPAVPSEFDRAIAWSSYSYIIVSVEQGQATDLNSWTLDEDHQFQPEEILIIDSKLSKS